MLSAEKGEGAAAVAGSLWGFLSDQRRRRLERMSADDGEGGIGWERGEEDGATVEADL